MSNSLEDYFYRDECGIGSTFVGHYSELVGGGASPDFFEASERISDPRILSLGRDFD
jgi:hypothetical protein